jgi:DNA polymerase elongation subunit (family B)
MKLNFFLTDVDYEVSDKTNIRLFGRSEDGKSVCVFDDSLQPYFYIFPKKSISSLKERVAEHCKKKKISVEFKKEKKSYLEEKYDVLKVILSKPSEIMDVVKIAKEYTDMKKEIDIDFSKKYLVDNNLFPSMLYEVEGEKINSDIAEIVIKKKKIKCLNKTFENPKVLSFDIETYIKFGSFPNPNHDPIISIAIYGPNIKKVISWKKTKTNIDVIFTKNEKETIEKFMDLINKNYPDYLVGYFSDGFDMSYIKKRCEKYKIDFKIGLEKVKFRRGREVNTAECKGIIHLDICRFIKKIMADSLKIDNYDLESVAKELIKDEKGDFDVNKTGLVWDHGGKALEALWGYNLQDAKLAYNIFQKILPNMNELVKIIGQPIHDICRMSYGQLVEWYLIRKAHESNEICPNRPTGDKIRKRIRYSYIGGLVVEPKPGLYDNLVILDFKGLYPSIIIAHNISLGTFTKERGRETIEIETEKGKNIKYRFKTKKGFIPQAIEELIITRDKVKEKLKKKKDSALLARSYALKTIANASYGYMGFFGARWYCRECAEAIAGYARYYIKETAKKANKEGFNIIYGDTDSLAIILDKKTKKDVKDFVRKVNNKLPSAMELEIEGYYSRGIFVMKRKEESGAKKKYALINEKGEIIIRGFETIRRDWSYLTKEVQKKVLEIILKEKNIKKAKKYVDGVINDIRKHKIYINKMVIRTTLKKSLDSYKQIGPHVVVARRMKKKGMDVSIGTTIKYIISEKGKSISDKARIPEECEDYDSEYYVNNQIIPAVGRIFDVLGYKKEELRERKGQKKLGDF